MSELDELRKRIAYLEGKCAEKDDELAAYTGRDAREAKDAFSTAAIHVPFEDPVYGINRELEYCWVRPCNPLDEDRDESGILIPGKAFLKTRWAGGSSGS